jgi:hypothetical protein
VDFFVERCRSARGILTARCSHACLAVIAWRLEHGVELQGRSHCHCGDLARAVRHASACMVPMCLVLLQHFLGSLAEARRDEP